MNYNISGPYCKVVDTPINLNSHQQVKDFLLSVGWIPTQYNISKKTREPTTPKLTEDSFDSIKDGVGQLVARRNILMHRRRTIENIDDPENKGILPHIRDDGRIAAEGLTCATPTGRTTHRGAICNVPKASPKVVFGKEMRSLFKVLPPYMMIGADLKAIEARVVAHWASLYDGGEYWKMINSVEDYHTYNSHLINNTRDVAKSFLYAIMYGARATKLSRILGCSVVDAENYIENFWDGNKGIKLVIDNQAKFFKKYGFLVGLDGRKLYVRAEYRILNTIIQSTAALIFKMWLNNANRELQKHDIYCRQIIEYHDEAQYRCHKDDVDVAIPIIQRAANKVQEDLNLYVPIDCDCKCGMNWSQTH